MKVIETPVKLSVDRWHSTVDIIFYKAEHQPNLILFNKVDGTLWSDVTARDFAAQVESVAQGFIALGIQPGDRVALMSSTRYEWPLIDYAIWSVGAVTVPIYESSSPEQIRWILQDSEAKILILENDVHMSRFEEIPAESRNLDYVFQIEPGKNNTIAATDFLIEQGKDIPVEQVQQRIKGSSVDDVATLIYTSGTTGKPKGVTLSHRNFISEAVSISQTTLMDLMKEGTKTLFFLPLAHVFARAISIAALYCGSSVGHFGDTNAIIEQFSHFKPDYVVSVPRVFEKVYAISLNKAAKGGKEKIFLAATNVAVAYSKAKDLPRIPLGLKIKYRFFDKLVFHKLRDAFGGNCLLAISGGAPLSERLGHFFRGMGIPIYEGYGLTETTAAITVNTIGHHKVGTVGLPLPGQSVAIADDGEILLKGSVVFTGYWQNLDATEQAIEDGWFHSGDLGTLDDDGYLKITGRKKEILVTAGGKNVSPTPLEEIIKENKLVSQAVVIGDGKPFIGALVTLDPLAFEQWKVESQKPAQATIADLRDDPDLLTEVDHAIAEANKSVSKAEAIKKFRVLTNDFSVETGELTQSMKVRRNIVIEKYHDDVQWVYAKAKK